MNEEDKQLIDELLRDSDKCQMEADFPGAILHLEKIWEILRGYAKSGDRKREISEIDQETDYQYNLQMRMYDLMVLYERMEDYHKSIIFCEEILEIFAWELESADEYRRALVEMLYEVGRIDESLDAAEKWQQKEPDNSAAQAVMIWCLTKQKKYDDALKIIEHTMKAETECSEKNSLLFYQASFLYKELGDMERSQAIRKKYDDYQNRLMEHLF